MKVLRPGRPSAEWSREVTCTGKGNGGHGCQALLLVGKDDLFKTCASVAGVGGTWFISFKCPECGRLNDLQILGDPGCQNHVPPDIIATLMPRLAWEAAQQARKTKAEEPADGLNVTRIREVERAAQQAAVRFNQPKTELPLPPWGD